MFLYCEPIYEEKIKVNVKITLEKIICFHCMLLLKYKCVYIHIPLDKGRFKQWSLAITVNKQRRMNKLVRTLSNSLKEKDGRKGRRSNQDLSRLSIWNFYLMEIGKDLFIILALVLKFELFSQIGWKGRWS